MAGLHSVPPLRFAALMPPLYSAFSNHPLPEGERGFLMVDVFFPKGLWLNPGAFTAFLLVLLFLVYLVWKAISDEVLALIKEWFKTNRTILLLSFIYLLPLLACLVTESYYAAGAMVVPAVLASILYARRKLSPSVPRLALVQLGVLLLAVGLQAGAIGLQKSIDNKRLKVYLVLPVDSPGGGLDEIVNLSSTLREEINKIFGPAEVRVQPKAYSKVDDLNQWKEMRSAVDKVWEEGLETDLVLINQAKADEDVLNLLLGVKVHLPDAGRGEFKDLDQVLLPGRRKYLKYLALRVCLQIVGEIKTTPQALRQEDEALIEKKILERYRDFLILEKDPSAQSALEKTMQALKNPALSYDHIQEIIAQYPDEEAELRLQRRIGETKTDSWRHRTGLENLLPIKAAETTGGEV